MTDTIDKVAFAAAELLAASEALASAAAEVDALRAELARQTGIAVDHCARADAAEKARDEVGIQLAAAQAEIARMRPVVEAARRIVDDIPNYLMGSAVVDLLRPALRALDAVPGDALAPMVPPSPAGVSAPASGSTPAASSATGSSSEVAANPSAHRGTCDRITAALEANGIDTSNVKGVR